MFVVVNAGIGLFAVDGVQQQAVQTVSIRGRNSPAHWQTPAQSGLQQPWHTTVGA